MNMAQVSKFSLPEKIIFFAGLLILAALLTYLIFQSFNGKEAHVNLNVTISEQTDPSGKFKARVKNKGHATAEGVTLIFALYDNGKEITTTTATANYIPSQSEKVFWIAFPEKKEMDSLVLSSLTYREP